MNYLPSGPRGACSAAARAVGSRLRLPRVCVRFGPMRFAAVPTGRCRCPCALCRFPRTITTTCHIITAIERSALWRKTLHTHLGVHDGTLADVSACLLGFVLNNSGVTQQHDLGQIPVGDLGVGGEWVGADSRQVVGCLIQQESGGGMWF